MTDKPENVELADAQYRHKLTRDIHARAVELRAAIAAVYSAFPDPATRAPPTHAGRGVEHVTKGASVDGSRHGM